MSFFAKKPRTMPDDTKEQFLCALYEKYAAYLKHISLSYLHDEQSAEDIVGEVFLHVVKNIFRLEQYSCSQINNYLVICTRGRCLNQLRTRKEIFAHEESLYDAEGAILEIESPEPAIDLQVLKKIDLETAAQLLEEVTPAYRDAFKLKYQMGLDNDSIAEAIEIQPQSVNMYVRRAQNQLRKLALKRGIVCEE